MKLSATATETHERYVAAVESKRERLASHPLPDPEIVSEAIAGILNSRDGSILRKPRTFSKHPLGSLLLRRIQWHRSAGNLMGAIMGDFDSRDEAKRRGLDPGEFADQIDTLALVLIGGRSRAADAWGRALGR